MQQIDSIYGFLRCVLEIFKMQCLEFELNGSECERMKWTEMEFAESNWIYRNGTDAEANLLDNR